MLTAAAQAYDQCFEDSSLSYCTIVPRQCSSSATVMLTAAAQHPSLDHHKRNYFVIHAKDTG
jgi:hypothetical protein